MDPRQVGQAMRRRIGAPMGHLQMAGGSSMGKKIPGVPSSYPTGSGSVGSRKAPIAGPGRNADRASRVSAAEPRRTAFHDSVMSQNEAIGARLTISPSMNQPVNAPESQATQGNGRIVDGKAGRSKGDFYDAQGAVQVGPPQRTPER